MDKLTKCLKEQPLLSADGSQKKEELVQWLVDLNRRGEQSAVDFGYAHRVAASATDRDDEVSSAAITALGDMGKEGSKHSHVVASCLSRSPKVAVAAATALGQFGHEAGRYCEQLAGCTEVSCDEALRAAAAAALGSIGAESQAAVLARLLDDPSVAVAAAACQALGKLPSGLQEASRIAKKLQATPSRHAAVSALGSLGSSTVEKYIGEITSTCLQDKDSLTRLAAANTLAVASPTVLRSGGRDIAGLLKHQEPGVRCTAALSLGKLGKEAVSYAADVAALLTDDAEDDSESYLAIGGGSLRSPALLRRPKCAALVALGLMGAESYAPAIASAFRDKSYEVKLCAMDALVDLGEAGRRQASNLMALMEDDVYIVRARACECIAALKADEVMSSVPEMLQDTAPSVRQAALKALSTCPEVAKAHSSEVFQCMSDEYGTVRAAAMTTLAGLGTVGQSFASAIAMELNTQDPFARAAACKALGRLGDYGAAFADEIAVCQEDSIPMVRSAAAAALQSLGLKGLANTGNVQMLSNEAIVDEGELE